MAKLSKLVKGGRFVAILYGKPKCGKTVLASQFPNPFFINLDPLGYASLSVVPEGADFEVVDISEEPTTDPVFVKWCGQGFVRQQAWLKTRKLTEEAVKRLGPDDTLVVDNLSRLAEYLVAHIEKKTGRRPLQVQDWNWFVMYLREFIEVVTTGGKCNVILVAHEQVHKDELDGAMERTIYMPTGMRWRAPSVVGEFWYLKAEPRGKEVRRVLQCVPDRKTPCGSRCWMPDIEEPTYEKMKPYLEKGLGRQLPPPTWTPGRKEKEGGKKNGSN